MIVFPVNAIRVGILFSAASEEEAMGESSGNTSTGLTPNVAGLLCYVLGWVTGIIFLLLEKDNQFVRFHAIQSIIAFGAITVLYAVVSFIPAVGRILEVLIYIGAFILWIVLMVKAYQGQRYKLPVAGDIAEQRTKPAA
jgi:uncharacterized membrane protein